MKRKIIIKSLIVIVSFVFSITIAFSDKEKNDFLNNPRYSKSFSQNLSNELSTIKGVSHIDTIINNFIKKEGIKGASVAISKNGRLVYAKGYGYSNVEKKELTTPGNLYRIASVSKLITATAVFKLIDEGKLSLDDKVFGKEGILTEYNDFPVKDKRVHDITIEHLLSHTAGWERRKGDPMFMPLTISRIMKTTAPPEFHYITKYVLLRKLDYTPGTKYSYSNYGYVLLGKIIEKVSGLPYEDYVRVKILYPLGIYDMQIGNSFYYQRVENEVKYYEPQNSTKALVFDGSGEYVPYSYGGNNITDLNAAGGWIATSADLLKFLTAIDSKQEKPDILSKESLEIMTRSDNNIMGPMGWRGSDGQGMWWRTGTLSGSSALLLHQRNNVCWMMIINSTSSKKTFIHNSISKTMFKVVSQIRYWPKHDLFDYQYPEMALEH